MQPKPTNLESHDKKKKKTNNHNSKSSKTITNLQNSIHRVSFVVVLCQTNVHPKKIRKCVKRKLNKLSRRFYFFKQVMTSDDKWQRGTICHRNVGPLTDPRNHATIVDIYEANAASEAVITSNWQRQMDFNGSKFTV